MWCSEWEREGLRNLGTAAARKRSRTKCPTWGRTGANPSSEPTERTCRMNPMSERFAAAPVQTSRNNDGSATTMTLDAETGVSQAADDKLLLSRVARQD